MQKFANAARSNLALGINNAVTSFSVTAGTGAKFPTLGTGDWFYATLQEGDTLEIVKVTARSTDTFTVVRAQNGTTASAFTTAAVVGLRPVAADFDKAVGFQTAYNVLSYGADATGTVSSSAAIQAAIDAAYADGGGLVEIPAGAYLLTAELETYPTVTIRGAGRRVTRLLANTNGMRMIFCDTTTNAGVVIRDMTLLGNGKSAVTGVKLHGLSKANGERISNIFLSDLELFGTATELATGIDLKFCVNVKLSSIWISLTTTGISSDNSADVDMSSITVQNGSGTGISIIGDGAAGVGYSQDEGYRLVGCNTNGQAVGLSIDGQDWGTASSCSFTTAPDGALVMAGSQTWRFSGCEFSASTFAVVQVVPATYSSVVRNPYGVQFTGCNISIGTWGMLLNGDEHVVSGCTFTACSANDLFMGNAGTTRYCSITGNTFSSANANPRIQEGASGITTNYNSFVGNTIKQGGGPGLLQASGSGANSLYQIPTTPATPLNVLYA